MHPVPRYGARQVIPVELLGDAQPLPRHLVNVHQCGACATVYGEVPTTATPKPRPFRAAAMLPEVRQRPGDAGAGARGEVMATWRQTGNKLVELLARAGYQVAGHQAAFVLREHATQAMMNKAAGEAAPTWELRVDPMGHTPLLTGFRMLVIIRLIRHA